MDAIASRTQPKVHERKIRRDVTIDRVLWVSQIVLLACGIAAPIAGLALAIVHGVFPRIAVIGGAATVLCISTIPLLLLGSHLMDVSDRRRQRLREQQSSEEVC